MITGSLRSNRGNFYSVLNLYDKDGKRKQKTVNLHIVDKPGNKRKAEKAHQAVLAEYSGRRVEVYQDDILFCDYLKVWLEEQRVLIEPNTYESYLCNINIHIFPHFKQTKLSVQDIRYKHIKSYYTLKSKTLSTCTLKKHHTVIKQTLRKAVQDELIAVNPAAEVRFPKSQPFKGRPLSVKQGDILLEAAHGTILEAAVILGMMYGLRRSEIAGLKWDAVDFQKSTITIQHTVTRFTTKIAKDKTKSKSSNRVLPLNEGTKKYLLRLRATQAQNKLLLGPGYLDTPYVVRWPDGHAASPDYISASFKKLLRKAGLPEETRLHDLRHSCGSFMVKMGYSLKDVADWLGHADINMSNRYAQTDLESKQEVAQGFASLLAVK